jgi:uncharacterized protein DUF4145
VLEPKFALDDGAFSVVPAQDALSIRCPFCRQVGTFEPIEQGGVNAHDVWVTAVAGIRLGQRRCPNVQCRGHIFVADNGQERTTFPPELLDFDASNLPTPVVAALEEAIKCHANKFFIAAAVLVRKTLEELCRDQGATGDSLKDRIRDLGSRVVISKDLLEGLDDLAS